MNLLETHLANIYTAERRGNKADAINDFKLASGKDSDLKTLAHTRLKELDALVGARGEGACVYSTRYRNYLKEALE